MKLSENINPSRLVVDYNFNSFCLLTIGPSEADFSKVVPQEKILTFETNEKYSLFILRGVHAPEVFSDDSQIILIWSSVPKSEKILTSKKNYAQLMMELHLGKISSFLIFNLKTMTVKYKQSQWAPFNIYSSSDSKIFTTDYLVFNQKQLALNLENAGKFIENGYLVDNDLPIDGVKKIGHVVSRVCDILNGRKVTTPQSLYEKIKVITNKYLKENNVKWISLTGGADTRLILSTIEDRNKYNYWVDCRAQTNSKKADYEIFKKLVTRYNLKGVALLKGQNEFFGDVEYNFKNREEFFNQLITLTGHCGGEFLGFQVNLMQRQEFDPLHFRDHFYKVKNANLSSVYEDVLWTAPYRLLHSNRSFSPFTHPDIIEKILRIPAEDMKGYGFYRKIYRECASEFVDIPFQSDICDGQDFVRYKLPTDSEKKLNSIKEKPTKEEYRKQLIESLF